MPASQKTTMVRFKRDPENPPQFTPEQAERLEAHGQGD